MEIMMLDRYRIIIIKVNNTPNHTNTNWIIILKLHVVRSQANISCLFYAVTVAADHAISLQSANKLLKKNN